MQLEDLQVDWDTGEREYIKFCEKYPGHYINIQWQEQQAEGPLEEEVDSKPGKQLEDLQVNWDTGRKFMRQHEKHPNVS